MIYKEAKCYLSLPYQGLLYSSTVQTESMIISLVHYTNTQIPRLKIKK